MPTDGTALKKDAERVIDWLDKGASSWGMPGAAIRNVAEAVLHAD